jgi:hypothetical protein
VANTATSAANTEIPAMIFLGAAMDYRLADTKENALSAVLVSMHSISDSPG